MKWFKRWLKLQVFMFVTMFITPVIIALFGALIRAYFPDYALGATAIFTVVIYSIILWLTWEK